MRANFARARTIQPISHIGARGPFSPRALVPHDAWRPAIDSTTDDILLVIRDTGERTAPACRAIVGAQLPADRIVVLHEKPFSAAVRRGLEIGVERRPGWLMTLDADVLLLPEAIARLRHLCSRVPEATFHVKGLLLCKVFGGVQPRGFHAFRGSLLDRALACAGGPAVKPERAVIRAMEETGFGRVFFPDVLGVHDYEQWYRHLYLKSLLRARKTAHLDALRSRLTSRATDDPDLRVALWGLEDAAASAHHATEWDWDGAYPAFEARLARDRLSEKEPFDAGDALGYGARIIESYRPAPDDLHHPDFEWSEARARCTLTDRARTDPASPARDLDQTLSAITAD